MDICAKKGKGSLSNLWFNEQIQTISADNDLKNTAHSVKLP